LTFQGLKIALVTRKARLQAGWGVRTRSAESFNENSKERLSSMIDSKALHATSAIMTLNPFIIYRDAPHIVHYEM